jgi:hypothetical protein
LTCFRNFSKYFGFSSSVSSDSNCNSQKRKRHKHITGKHSTPSVHKAVGMIRAQVYIMLDRYLWPFKSVCTYRYCMWICFHVRCRYSLFLILLPFYVLHVCNGQWSTKMAKGKCNYLLIRCDSSTKGCIRTFLHVEIYT